MIKTSKSILAALVAVGLCMSHHSVVGATTGSDTATQTVTIQVDPINVISVIGEPILHVMTATAGSAPTTVTDSTARYAVTTNQEYRKITGSIDGILPSGMQLLVSLGAPSTATSLGETELTNADADLVTGISQVNESNLPISYKLITTSQVAPISTSVVVTYTITAGAE